MHSVLCGTFSVYIFFIPMQIIYYIILNPIQNQWCKREKFCMCRSTHAGLMRSATFLQARKWITDVQHFASPNQTSLQPQSKQPSTCPPCLPQNASHAWQTLPPSSPSDFEGGKDQPRRKPAAGFVADSVCIPWSSPALRDTISNQHSFLKRLWQQSWTSGLPSLARSWYLFLSQAFCYLWSCESRSGPKRQIGGR